MNNLETIEVHPKERDKTINQVPVLFTPAQTSEILNISRSKIYELINQGKLDSCQIGRSRRISVNQIETFIQNLKKVTT